MINNKKILAIIPARGGSKGVPKKNIKLLDNKPLIEYTIEAAKNSKYIDKLMVSTDNEEIAEISRNYGEKITYLRPAELAQDDTPTMDVILYCINMIENIKNYHYDYICLLQCTSPFRTCEHIDEALEILINNNGDSIIGLCESENSPYWMKKIVNGKIEKLLDDSEYIRRQDLPTTYITNGALYIIKTELLKEIKDWYTCNTLPYVMDNISSIDIDTNYDFEWAEFIINKIKKEGSN